MSFINSYDEIKAQIEERIDNIDGLSATDAALVAAAAQLLNGRNQSIANMQALLTYLQNRQDGVDDDTTIKDIVLLLGASMGSKNVVWRMQEFLSDGTFTVPNNIAGGVVYVTGSGGGGSGGVWITNAQNNGIGGACSGCYVEKRPVTVAANSSVSVVVGAGGAAVSANAITAAAIEGNAGNQSSFGALVIPGGSGGGEIAGNSDKARQGGWIGGYMAGSAVYVPQNSIRYRAGQRVSALTAFAMGSAAGAFGNGAAGAASSGVAVTAASADANSGAGGGGAVFYTSTAPSIVITSGAGGSGRIIVEWQEFV
jgi:hypothetical protein